MDTDLAILQRYAATRDPDCFARLVERHAAMVHAAALRITRNLADADDVTQECFLELTRKANGVRSSLAAWLHLTATNRARDLQRHQRAQARLAERSPAPVVDFVAAEWAEIAPVLDEALAGLPEELRLPLIHHFLEGRANDAVARELGLGRRTVNRRIADGLRLLQEALRRRGIAPDAGRFGACLAVMVAPPLPAGTAVALGKIGLSGLVHAGAAPAAAPGATFLGLGPTAAAAASAAAIGAVGLLSWSLASSPARAPSPSAPPPPQRATQAHEDPPMKSAILLTSSLLGAQAHAAAALDLTPGVWTDITPPGVTMTPATHVFCQGVTLDPVDPLTIYLCVCAYEVAKAGLFKTTDGGATWARIGQLDEPIHLEIDPHDRQHLYCVDGVRGNTIGFWESHDGGATWSMPPGFTTATARPPTGVGTTDLYSLSVDPTDFKHVLVSFHSPWANSRNCGVLESTDGGASWTARQPPSGADGGYGMAIFFLFDPATKQGDAKTWLFTAQQGGFFRTTDGGATWTLAYPLQMTHGGNQLYRTKDGTLYAGAYQYPVRSTDNGASWQPLKNGLPYSWYIGICGDGTNLYTGCTGENQPVFTSPEADGLTWKPLAGGSRTFSTDPFEMRFDRVHRILYSATFGNGFFAIKVPAAAGK